jgi:hypothetical protein
MGRKISKDSPKDFKEIASKNKDKKNYMPKLSKESYIPNSENLEEAMKWKFLQYDSREEAKNAREEHFKTNSGNPCRHLVGNKLAYVGTFHGTLPTNKKDKKMPPYFESYIPLLDSIITKQPVKFKSLFESLLKEKANLYIEDIKNNLHKNVFNIKEDSDSLNLNDPNVIKNKKNMNPPKIKKVGDVGNTAIDTSNDL